jgi:hypothetical protein
MSSLSITRQADSPACDSPATVTTKSKRVSVDHKLLEDRIIQYQAALKAGDLGERERRFNQISEIYNPRKYLKYWSRKYLFLFDTEDDFESDFMQVFCASLSAWMPAEQRAESRYGGKGLFQNYFWGSLSHSYINKLKASMAAKRNQSQKCPICDSWCSTLSTHLIENHDYILFDWLAGAGYEIDTMTSCPFCKSFRTPITAREESMSEEEKFTITNDKLKKHLLHMHSHLLFERFHDLHPECQTIASNKTASIYQSKAGEEDEEVSVYDTMPATGGIDGLLSQNLSDLQKQMIEQILNGKSALKYNAKVFQCTEDEYADALSGLQNAMMIAGFEV